MEITTIAMAATITGIVLGSIILFSVAHVYIKKKDANIMDISLAIIGSILLSLSIFQTVEIKNGDIFIKLEKSLDKKISIVREQIRTIKLAPITEAVPKERMVNELQGVSYADLDQNVPQVKNWLQDEYSGYPSLLRTLKELLKKRCPIGNPVPLNILNKRYLGDKEIVIQHDPEMLKRAYVETWRERNPESSVDDFDIIAPACGDSEK